MAVHVIKKGLDLPISGTPEQRIDSTPRVEKVAVLARDYNRMIAAGGNIYFLAKIFASDGLSFQYAAATMTGMTQEEYAQMMLDGGRSPDGNRHIGEKSNG